MIRDGKATAAFARLVDALSADLLAAEDDEILSSHAGQAGRVAADAVRQAIRRGATRTDDGVGVERDLVRRLTMRPHREDKP